MKYENIRLHTERLDLRPFAVEDTQDWFSIMSDPVVLRYWSHTAWESQGEAESAIRNDMAAMANNEYLKLAVVEKSSGKVIGMCIAFSHHAASRRIEIGYCLATDAQKKGYMREAMHAFILFLQQKLNIRRFEADIHPDNLASRGLLMRMGFELEGRLKERWIVGEEISDSLVFGLLSNKEENIL